MWQFLTLSQEHNDALWAGHGQSFLSVEYCIIHTCQKISQKVKYEVNILSKSFGGLQLREQDWWGGTLIYIWAIKTYLLHIEFALI